MRHGMHTQRKRPWFNGHQIVEQSDYGETLNGTRFKQIMTQYGEEGLEAT